MIDNSTSISNYGDKNNQTQSQLGKYTSETVWNTKFIQFFWILKLKCWSLVNKLPGKCGGFWRISRSKISPAVNNPTVIIPSKVSSVSIGFDFSFGAIFAARLHMAMGSNMYIFKRNILPLSLGHLSPRRCYPHRSYSHGTVRRHCCLKNISCLECFTKI